MAVVSGETKTWHKITFDFETPQTFSESPATFRNYRLDVTFTNKATGETITVPGYFAADGDAADTGASSGNVWRAHFSPPSEGSWTYEATLRTGKDVAVSLNPTAGSNAALNGANGSFVVTPSDKTGDDLRSKGKIVYDGTQYLKHEGDGSLFLKSGVGSPENFLAHKDFDNTPDNHTYAPHLSDWNAGDPTWDGGKGKGIIGAVNYLAAQDVNSAYFLLMNVGGDGRDVWPWSDTDLDEVVKFSGEPNKSNQVQLTTEAQSFDVSKLAQWEIVFEHMQEKGINLHMFLQETENDYLLNNGEVGLERMLFIREMVARFGHHNGVIWNLGEENTNTPDQIKDHSAYLKALDAYDHPVALHTFPNQHDRYESHEGTPTLDALSFQTSANLALPDLDRFLSGAEDAGRPLVAFLDEPGSATVGLAAEGDSGWKANHDIMREGLWTFYMEGGSGVEWYFGYQTAGGQGGDLRMEDFSFRESAYEWTAAAREFFEELPLEEMSDADTLTTNTKVPDEVLAKIGEVYAIYLEDGGSASLNLKGVSGTFDVLWYDVIDGTYSTGTVETLQGGAIRNIGTASSNVGGEWAVLVAKDGFKSPPDAGGGGDDGGDNGGSGSYDGYYEAIKSAGGARFKVQLEDAGEDPGGRWSFVDKPVDGKQKGFQGDGYYVYGTPGGQLNIRAPQEEEMLTYRLEVPEGEEGLYSFRLRVSRDGGVASDRENDAWVDFSKVGENDSIEDYLKNYPGNEAHPVSDGMIKVYGGPNNGTWGYAQYYDGKPDNKKVELLIEEAGVYELTIAGRSEGFHIDYFELAKGGFPGVGASDSPYVEGDDGPSKPPSDPPKDPPADPPNKPPKFDIDSVKFKVIDRDTGSVIDANLTDGEVLQRGLFDGHYEIVATGVTGTEVDSMRVSSDGKVNVDDAAPWTVFSSVADGKINNGEKDLSISFLSQDGAKGTLLGTTNLSYEIVKPKQLNFDVFLVDSETDGKLATLTDGMSIELEDLDALNLTIFATTSGPDVGSVRLEAPGIGTKLENVAPYALFGDVAGDFNTGVTLEPGDYSVILTAYSGAGGTGSVLGKKTIDFTLGDPAPANLNPIAKNDTAATDEDRKVTINVLGNDWDETPDDLQITLVDDPSSGTARVVDGKVVYTPHKNKNGMDSFTYRLTDDEGKKSGLATVKVNVKPVNDAPVTQDLDVKIEWDDYRQLTYSAGDFGTDPDGNFLYFYKADSKNGEVVLAGEASILFYTPHDGFVGTDTVSVTLWDQYDETSLGTAKLKVDVSGPPVIVPETPSDAILLKAVNIGGDAYTALDGTVYEADTISDARTYSTGAAITGTKDDILFQSEAFGPNGLDYEFDVKNGRYNVQLDFAEIWKGASTADARVFDVTVEGEKIDDFDIFDEVGLNHATTKNFEVEVTDGTLNIELDGEIEHPKLSALRVFQYDEPEDVSDYLDFFVADADSDAILAPIVDGKKIDADLAGVDATVFAVLKDGAAGVGSVKLAFEDHKKLENVEPFALFGDKDGDFLGGADFAGQSNTIDVEVYSGAAGKGQLLESFQIDFFA